MWRTKDGRHETGDRGRTQKEWRETDTEERGRRAEETERRQRIGHKRKERRTQEAVIGREKTRIHELRDKRENKKQKADRNEKT